MIFKTSCTVINICDALNNVLNELNQIIMDIERTKKEVIIRLSPNVDTEDLQKFLNYARYKELTSNFKVSQDQVDDLVSEIKNNISIYDNFH